MTWQILFTLCVLVGAIVALAFLSVAPDLVLLCGLTLLLAAQIVTPTEALSGFANEGLITVAVMFIVAEGMRQTGGLSFAGQTLLGSSRKIWHAQARVMVPTALMSAFLNNTPVVAMMMPVLNDWAKKNGVSVSRLLLPLSYAAILGGMATLVGTSTTIVVNDLIKSQAGLPGLRMFEIAWIGVPASILGMIYVLFAAKHLLPERKPAFTPLDDPREYTVEMIVQPGSALVGKSIGQAGLRSLPGMYLMEIDRRGHVIAAVSSEDHIEANDRLVFVGVVESVVDLQRIPGLQPATEQVFKLDAPRSERCLIEAVVSNSCPYVRQTIRESRFRSNYNAAVIAVARNGQRIRKKIGDIELLAGDTLLLEAHPSFAELQRNSRDFFLVSQVQDSSPPRHEMAWVARMILGGMVIAIASEQLPIVTAAFLAAGLMIATRCCRWSEAKRSLEWGVLLTIGAGLGLGKAMESSGAAVLIARGLIEMVGEHPQAVLAMVYAITMVLTNLITAKAAAVLIFPIAVAAAGRLGADPMPFAIAIIIAAAASFATPIGYQTNLMVYGPGGYRFSDYVRLGVPLSLIVWLVASLVTPVVWPLYP